MSLSPKDMDFIEAKHVAAREIALALGVPPMLLGIPGDNTYSNYQEATRSLWRQTVLPLATRTAKALSQWLSPAYGAPLELRPDLDAIEALTPEREALWSRIDKATFLAPNEKRTAVGYGPAEVSDLPGLTPPLDGQPAQKAGFRVDQLRNEFGQWATEDGGGNGLRHEASRRPRGSAGTPAQEARHDAAAARAREAVRRLRELEPTWQGPQSVSETIEGRIAHLEATARAAEARLAEILRDAIPDTNPSWGVNRLVKELHERGFILERPTDSPGRQFINPETGERIRIMERPPFRYPSDPPAKFTFGYYYRYKPGRGKQEGSHVPIPDKD